MELSALLCDDTPLGAPKFSSEVSSLAGQYTLTQYASSAIGLYSGDDYLLDFDLAETTTDVNDRYSISDLLGDGSYASVRLAHRKLDSKAVAVKTINKRLLFSEAEKLAVKTEVELHAKVNHPNIVKLYEVYETPRHIHLVMELCDGCTLDQYLKRIPGRSLSEKAARNIFTQLISAISHLVDKGMIHGDIKLSNILLAQPSFDKECTNFTLKVCDFGFARSVLNKFNMPKGVIGTAGFIAPEVLEGSFYSYPIDMWSCGIVLYMMLFGVSPFRNSNDTHLEFPDTRELSDSVKDLIYGLVCAHPSKRLRADQVPLHPWIKS